MKIYIPSVAKASDFRFPMEMFTVLPFLLGEETYQELCKQNGFWNDGIFSKLLFSPPPFEKVGSVEAADYVIYPIKYSKDDDRVRQVCSQAAVHDRLVFAFFCDDSAERFDLPNNLVLFRTSLYKSTRTFRERPMPVLIPDHKPCSLLLTDRVQDKIITYCGHGMHNRHEQLQKLHYLHKDTNIIERKGFWAPEIPKIIARRQYYENLMSGALTFCSRGGGNFSYRFYEALSFGRIPVLIDTDCELPFEYSERIKWEDHIIRINETTFMNMTYDEFRVLLFDKCKNLSPKRNREIWEQLLSPEGYLKNFDRDV